MKSWIARNILKHKKHPVGYLYTGKGTALIALISGMVFAVCFAPVSAQNPAEKDLKKFYHVNCAGCHGTDGSAVDANGKRLKGEDFTDQGWQQDTTDEKMINVIMKGLFFGLAMPGFKDSLTENEARRMVTDIIRKSEKGRVIYRDTEN